MGRMQPPKPWLKLLAGARHPEVASGGVSQLGGCPVPALCSCHPRWHPCHCWWHLWHPAGAPQQIMKDKWINIGYEGDELKPYKEPEEDFGDTKRIGEGTVPPLAPRGGGLPHPRDRQCPLTVPTPHRGDGGYGLHPRGDQGVPEQPEVQRGYGHLPPAGQEERGEVTCSGTAVPAQGHRAGPVTARCRPQVEAGESRTGSSLSLARVRAPSETANGTGKASSHGKSQRGATTYHRQRRHSDFCECPASPGLSLGWTSCLWDAE